MSGISDSQDGTKIEKYECCYCYRVFPDNFRRMEHESYGHHALKDVYRSRFYKNIHSKIKKLEDEIEEKTKIINSLEERVSKIEKTT